MPAVQHQQRPVSVHLPFESHQSLQDKRSLTSQTVHMANTTTNGVQAAAPALPAARKGKGKKNTDPVDTNKLLEQTMARLERDVAGDKEQEAEIGTYSLLAVLPYFM